MLSRPRPVIALTAGRRRSRVWVLVFMCRYQVRRCMIAAAALGGRQTSYTRNAEPATSPTSGTVVLPEGAEPFGCSIPGA